MLEKRRHCESEVGVDERKEDLEERTRAHVKFLSSGESQCFANSVAVLG